MLVASHGLENGDAIKVGVDDDEAHVVGVQQTMSGDEVMVVLVMPSSASFETIRKADRV